MAGTAYPGGGDRPGLLPGAAALFRFPFLGTGKKHRIVYLRESATLRSGRLRRPVCPATVSSPKNAYGANLLGCRTVRGGCSSGCPG